MIDLSSLALLKGKKALVTGIANDQSIAWGCAKAFRAFGADVAVTYLNDKTKHYVDPLAKQVEAPHLACRWISRSQANSRPFSTRSRRNGASSISCCTPSPSRRRTICTDASSTAPRTDF